MGIADVRNEYINIPASRDKGTEIPVGATIPEASDGGKVPVVVMVHGFLGTKDEWGFYYGATEEERGFDSIAARLYELGIGTIRVDMPGNGDSADDFRNYTLEKCRGDLEDGYRYCMEKYGFDPCRVGFLGWSMGAKIGSVFLLEHPEIKNAVLLNPAGDNGGRSIMNAVQAGLDYKGLREVALKKGEVLNEAATEVFGHEFYMSKDFFDQVDASETGDEIRQYISSGRRGLMIYGDSDSSISKETYKWLRENTGIQSLCVQDMDHDMGLESERPDFTITVTDTVAAFYNCYL